MQEIVFTYLLMLLQSPSVDCQHAIIEYRDVDETFALQDLNTTYGTYVNDCRIGNAYVRLYPGDVIRFGNSNTSYELVIHGESSVRRKNQYHFCCVHLLKMCYRRHIKQNLVICVCVLLVSLKYPWMCVKKVEKCMMLIKASSLLVNNKFFLAITHVSRC